MIDTYLLIYIIISRLFELKLSKKNTQKLKEDGAIELYSFHYKFIVIFHVIFITYFFVKSFYNMNLSFEYLYLFIIIQILRYKIIYDLGVYWTTRILVINKPLIKTWIFKYFRHPNYIIVFCEIVLVCLFFNDYYSLLFFSIVKLILICIRIFFEEKANRFRRKL